MYESHFGLSARPFAESVDPAAFVPLPSREAALRRLHYGIEHGRGPVLAFGPPGSGKTLLSRALARTFGGSVVHLTYPAMPAADLLAFLGDELNAPPTAIPGIAGSVRRVRGALSAAAANGKRPLVIVDEAHVIEDPATFEAIRLLLNFATSGVSDLALLLVGNPEIVLNLPPSLSDRLASHCLLGPLTPAESAAYVHGRLASAGALEPLFDADAIAALHRLADGLPRRLNRLADLALLIAYAQERDRPDAQSVITAAREATLEPIAA